jgi:hypothetical protein
VLKDGANSKQVRASEWYMRKMYRTHICGANTWLMLYIAGAQKNRRRRFAMRRSGFRNALYCYSRLAIWVAPAANG